MSGEEIELLNAVLDHLLADGVFGKDSNELFGGVEQLLRFILLEVISMAFAEGRIAFGKGFDADFADTVDVPDL